MNIYEVLPFYTIKKALMSLIHYYKPITTDVGSLPKNHLKC